MRNSGHFVPQPCQQAAHALRSDQLKNVYECFDICDILGWLIESLKPNISCLGCLALNRYLKLKIRFYLLSQEGGGGYLNFALIIILQGDLCGFIGFLSPVEDEVGAVPKNDQQIIFSC